MSNHSLCATRATLVATAALLLAAAGSPVLAQCEFAKLLAADGTAGAAFGGNVAVAGDVAVIAAPGDDERGEDAGATYVLRFRAGAPGEWVPEAKLVAADGVAGDRFGSAVAITGDVILIGASGVDDGGSEAGAAYVFRYDAGGSGTWTEDAKLLPAEAGAGDQFGCAVALAPDVAVIGARGAGIGGSAAGAAFVFRYGGGAWQPEARLLATDAGAGDHFGATVAVSSSTALIGAADVDAAGTDSGAAYVFRCSGADWSQEAKLLPVDGAGGDHFAAAIALTDGVALIGAPGADANGANAGSGYVFRRDGAVWSQESRLVASDAAAGDEFGCAVSISGDVAALGARFKDGVGGVYAFRHAGGEWAEEAALSAAEGRVGAELGGSVAVDGDNVFAGAMADDELAVGAGAAHVFSLSGADCNGNGICDSRDIAEQGVGFGNGDAWAAFDPGDYGVGNDPDGYEGAVFDGRYIYFVPYHNGTDKHGEVLRYDTTGDFAGVTSWTTYDPGLHGVGADPDGYVGAAWDGRYVYFTPYHNGQAFHGEVLRYDTTGEFADVASWNAYDAGAHGLGEIGVGYSGALAYGSHVYFTPRRRAGSHHGEVLRYTLGEFADLASWSAYDPGQNGLGFDPRGYNGVVFDGRHVYFVPHFRDNVFHGEVLCYDTTGRFHELASWAAYDAGEAGVGTDPDGYVGGAFDGRYIYFAPHHNSDEYHGEVLRFDTTGGFDDVSAWSTYDPGFAGLGSDVDGYNGAVFDGRFVYFVPYHNGNDFHGEVLRYDTTGGFAALESWATFDPAGADVGDNPTGFDRAVFDGRYVYFVPFNHGVHHGEVLRYDTAASGAPDCNGNGIPDECDIAGGLSTDCNGNGVPDACDIAVGFSWDCNGNGVPDECDIASGSSADCNGNRVPDECELDCNDNGVPDDCDIESWFSADCNGNRIPDECDIATGNSLDCNTNGVPDECDIDTGMSADCNSNGVPDECDIATGISADCNSNSVPDECDTAGGFSADCNGNGVPDECDVQGGSSADCNSNGVPDECEPDCNGNGVADECDIDAGTSPDCNSNGVPDECDVVSGSSADCDGDEVPDECEVRLFEERSPQLGPLGAGYPQSHVVAAPPPAGLEVTITFEAVGDLGGLTEWVDVDLNGVPLGRVFASGASDCSTQPDAAALTISGEMFNRAVGTGDAMLRMVASSAVDPAYCPISFIVVTLTYHAVMPDDCNGNGTPDNCDIAAGTSDDLNGNGVPDECEVDCNGNGVPDAWDIATGASLDCNGNGVPDECDISAGASTDVNANAVPDECEPDCNGNSVPDDWDLLQGSSPDCNDNAVPDECDLVSGLSADCNGNSVPDECETGLKPVIAVQPQGQAACLGAPVSFAVVADGIAPLHYQWRQDGRPIPGATADTLAIDPVGLLDTGKYTVVVSNTCGSITSAAAVLVVDSPASITVQPLAASACDGHAHEFCVQATGVDLAYQWQHDGVPIPGANGPCFSATLPGSYACVVSNQCGALSSATVTLSLTPGGPLLESGPVDVAVCAGAEAVFAVTASGSGLLHYAWDMNGQVVGTDAATLRLTAVTAADDAAQFVCHVSDGCGTVSSAAATLIVAAPTTWYRDADGDGYGDAQISVLTCDQPAGYVVDGSDCDDANSNVFPGAAESCDGLDNDCDGDVDEEAPLWYRDADGDGLGDAEDVVQACTAPAGYVANADDLVDVVQTVPVETPSLPETPAPPAEQSQQDVPEASGDGGSPPCGLPVLVVMLLGLVGSRRWTRAADTWSKR